jgi:hypothetical protein
MIRKRIFCLAMVIVTLAVMVFIPGCGKNIITELAEKAAGQVTGTGRAEAKMPEPEKLIASKVLGEVPANQVLIMLKDGCSKKDAEKAANDGRYNSR